MYNIVNNFDDNPAAAHELVLIKTTHKKKTNFSRTVLEIKYFIFDIKKKVVI